MTSRAAVAKQSAPPAVPERRTAALLSVSETAKQLQPNVDLALLRRGGAWYQQVDNHLGKLLLLPAVIGGGIGSDLFAHGAVVLGLGCALLGMGSWAIGSLGRIQTGSDEKWADQVSEAHLRAWLRSRWGIEAQEDAFANLDVRELVNTTATQKINFASVDGRPYKLFRLAKGGNVIVVDGLNREVRPLAERAEQALTVKMTADGHLQVFAEADRATIRAIRQQLVRLRAVQPIAPEDEYALTRANEVLAEAFALADRAENFEPEQRAQIFGELSKTLTHVLGDLTPRVAALAKRTVGEAQVLQNFTRQALAAPEAGIKLPPQAHQ